MNKKTAFTFIEIMIAIVIFSVGILVVLKLVTDNLGAMDKNNIKVQATLLAKEGMELAYNLRDANLEKELSWNCLMNEDMYSWSQTQLEEEVHKGQVVSNFEDVICAGYFGDENSVLQIGFDPDKYLYYKQVRAGDNFLDYYNTNKLYLHSKMFSGYMISWYAYKDDSSDKNGDLKDTNFARYLSFSKIKEGNKYLPVDKIMKVESHVLYMRGGNTGEVVFESFIGNY